MQLSEMKQHTYSSMVPHDTYRYVSMYMCNVFNPTPLPKSGCCLEKWHTFMSILAITNDPQDATTTEGGDVSYNCTAQQGRSENVMALLIGWRFTPSGSAASTVLISGTVLTGIEMVTVSGRLRTVLTFSGVRREADGGMVVCLAFGSLGSLESDPATLTVQCKS